MRNRPTARSQVRFDDAALRADTILRSVDQGASWSLLSPVVYPGGSGYSAMTLLPSSGPGDLLGVAFQRTIWDPNLEGGGYNTAFASVEVAAPVGGEAGAV